MTLTRHLYELDEVISALQTCLRLGWPRAHFWLWELLQSDEVTAALSTLRRTWLLWGAPYDPTIPTETPTEPAAWLTLLVRIQTAIKEAGSLTAERFLNLTAAMPERLHVTPSTRRHRILQRRHAGASSFLATLDPMESIDRKEAGAWWTSLDAAARHGSRTDTLWLLQAAQPILSADAIWGALRQSARGGTRPTVNLLCDASGPDPESQLLHQAAAALLLCLRGPDARAGALTRSSTPAAQHLLRDWLSLDEVVGRRAARRHAIPVEALHKETTRGSMSRRFTNIGHVREPVASLSEGCAWWRSACLAAGAELDEETNSLAFPSDEALENFVDAHFPDDIPDEWSRADQEKSHGRGCAEIAPLSPSITVRMEPVEPGAWAWGIHVPGVKKLTHVMQAIKAIRLDDTTRQPICLRIK